MFCREALNTKSDYRVCSPRQWDILNAERVLVALILLLKFEIMRAAHIIYDLLFVVMHRFIIDRIHVGILYISHTHCVVCLE